MSSSAIRAAAPQPDNRNILAIASGKGGVGKTWLSVTLSHLIARSGRRVLLVDGDIGLANVDVQLGITPSHDLSNVFSGRQKLPDIVTHFPEGGFDIIAGRSGSESIAAFSPQRKDLLKQELLAMAGQYDYVIIDLGAGIEDNVRFLSSIASKCLVVATDEPTSLTDAYAFIKLCTKSKPQPEVQVVINQAATQRDGEKTYESLRKACQSFLKASPPCLGIIRKDNKVKDCIRSQSLLVVKSPNCTAATDCAAISIKLLQR